MKIKLENFDVMYAELKEELLDAIIEKINESKENEISVGGWVNGKPLLSVYQKEKCGQSYFTKVENLIVTGDKCERTIIEFHLFDCTIDELLNIYRNIIYGK